MHALLTCLAAAHPALPRPLLLQAPTLVLLNVCLLGCALLCALLLLIPYGLSSDLLPHILGLLLVAVALAASVNWLVTLTGTVSAEEQQRELFGQPAEQLDAAGSSTVADGTAAEAVAAVAAAAAAAPEQQEPPPPKDKDQ